MEAAGVTIDPIGSLRFEWSSTFVEARENALEDNVDLPHHQRPPHQRDIEERLLAWFDRYLMR